ncbi:hypothetical protein BGZ59_011276 [Podila verticillata]|nr:hypothetical protein BGZ59_011276 [Podila verticillata]KAI9238516.1 MAG: hypothetical protein BYD32DRAFT_261451 [Podila humilis]
MLITGRRRQWLTLSLLLILLLTFLHNAAAAPSDEDDDVESFEDPVDIEDGSIENLPTNITSDPPAPTVDASPPPPTTAPPSIPPPPPPPSPPPASSPRPLPTVPSGILKAGTASPECAIIGDLYRATGPWQFVPDTTNCCNAEYPNSSGIKCNAQGQIIYIYLAGQGLSGTLPESLGSLTGLRYLLLYYNNLSGPIPSSLTNLPLFILDLSHNRLSGSLPSSGAGWAGLGTLNLEANALTGSIPEWLTTLPSLHSLAIGQNFFTTNDPIPLFTFNVQPSANGTVLSNIPANTHPETYVPPSSVFLENFVRLPKLRQLKLDSLGISGGFPVSWEHQMVNLTKLDLSNNSMQGLIPGYLNGFVGLKTLLLDRNEFGGAIPALDNLRSLAVLDLAYNQLSGPLPPWGAGLNLTILNLSNNLLSGPLPYDNHHHWRTCSVASNYFVCTKGPAQVLSDKWKSDCRAMCSDAQETVPNVRPPINTTLAGIKVHQTHNAAAEITIQWSIIAIMALPLFMFV